MISGVHIPIDLPGCSFSKQLEWLERWACLAPGTLLNSKDALKSSIDTSEGMVRVILDCIQHEAWDWPSYTEHIAQGGFQFSDDQTRDMAEQIYGKYRSRRMGLYRKRQIEGIKEFRPFWQLVGRCSGGDRRTYLADDEYWQKGCAPWNCPKLDCECRVDSLSRTELARYVEGGCESDPSAVELLKAWEAHENSDPNRVTCVVTVVRNG